MSIYLAHNHKMLRSAGRYVGWVQNRLPPLGANTIRVKWKKGEAPKSSISGDVYNSLHWNVDSITQVDSFDNIFDITFNSTDWNGMFAYMGNLADDRLIEIIDGNLQNVTDLNTFCATQRSLKAVRNLNTSSSMTDCHLMFWGCSALEEVALFNTSGSDDFRSMFQTCTSLRSVPVFNTSNGVYLNAMFYKCHSLEAIPQIATGSARNVENIFCGCFNAATGILSMYNQMSTQSTPPSSHVFAFKNCGRDSVTGAAELAQIPDGWK